jgi:hypothetical protein
MAATKADAVPAKKLDMARINKLPLGQRIEIIMTMTQVLSFMKRQLTDGTPIPPSILAFKACIEDVYGEIIDWEYQMLLADANKKKRMEEMDKRFSVPNGPTLEAWYAKIELIGPNLQESWYEYRERFTHEYSWAVPSRAVIGGIVAFIGPDQLLEVGAGRGLWAELLRLTIGYDRLVVTDLCVGIPQSDFTEKPKIEEKKAWFEEFVNPNQETFTHVLRCSGEHAVRKFVECKALLSIWPYMHPWIGEALEAFTGDKFIYVGEEAGGCTGADNLFDELELHWDLVAILQNPVWHGIHDSVHLYKRK